MSMQRRAGVLLHPTSLPGGRANGGFGPNARRFVDFLGDAGFSVWQVLPLGPVDATGSPYLLRSAFAGGLHLLDRESISASDWWQRSGEPPADADQFVAIAHQQFRQHADPSARQQFENFRNEQQGWLLPWSLYCLLTDKFAGAPWWQWPKEYRSRDADGVRWVAEAGRDDLHTVMFGQYLFARQWSALCDYAHERGVQIFGDLPFYVDRNSADVWWSPQNFLLSRDGSPQLVAGVPPDYFNDDGQLWGNPVYDWATLEKDGFKWWLERLERQSQCFDLLRIDHFRALEAYWVVPADAQTARHGHWEPAPGNALLEAVTNHLPHLALVAEDLGTITPEVTALREQFHLPGMLVLQFAFDGSADNPYLPANHPQDAVVYTGTHDNDTTMGWFSALEQPTRDYVRELLGDTPMPDALIHAAYQSPAQLAMIPLQDLLALGNAARMNMPGTTVGNWSWRFEWSDIDADLSARCRAQLALANRLPSGQAG